MIKKQLTENDIFDLAYLVNEYATLSMMIKSATYYENRVRYCFYPLVRLQSHKTSFYEYKERYGGSIYESMRNNKQHWTWNIQMIKSYFPQIMEQLYENKREKAKLILRMLEHTHGAGNPQDCEEIIKLYKKIKALQAPRPRSEMPWDNDRMEFY